MPKAKFSKEAFLNANQKAKEGGNFGAIEKGIYVATIEKATMKNTTNGARQASFGWQISDEDEHHPNQYVWWNQTLVNNDGSMNEIGLQILNQIYYSLSEGQFDPDDYKFDSSGEVLNDEEIHEKFHGTVAKIQVIPDGEYNGNPQYKIKVKSVIENAYQADNPKDEEDVNDSDLNADDSVDVDEEDTKDYKIYVNAPIIFMDKGKERRGRVISFIDGPTPGTGMLRVQPTQLADDTFTVFVEKPLMVAESDIFLALGVEPYPENPDFGDAPLEEVQDEVIDEDEVIEEETSKLEKGQKVSYPWEGKTLNGPIHEIDEDNGIIKVIAINGEGKKVARKVKMEEVIPF